MFIIVVVKLVFYVTGSFRFRQNFSSEISLLTTSKISQKYLTPKAPTFGKYNVFYSYVYSLIFFLKALKTYPPFSMKANR